MSPLALWLPVEYDQWEAPQETGDSALFPPSSGVAVPMFLCHRPQLPSGGPLLQLEPLLTSAVIPSPEALEDQK